MGRREALVILPWYGTGKERNPPVGTYSVPYSVRAGAALPFPLHSSTLHSTVAVRGRACVYCPWIAIGAEAPWFSIITVLKPAAGRPLRRKQASLLCISTVHFYCAFLLCICHFYADRCAFLLCNLLCSVDWRAESSH